MSNLKITSISVIKFAITLLVCFSFSIALATTPPSGPATPPSGPTTPPSGPATPPSGPVNSPLININWNNPLGEGITIEQVIIRVLEALIILATPIITLMIIYAGFLYVTARGNAEQVKKASAALTYAIIGGIMVIGAVAVTGIIEQTLCDFRPDGSSGC